VVTVVISNAPPPELDVLFTIESARVFKMPDGDTITINYDNGKSARVRLQGIDCPETAQNFGKEAGDIGREMLMNSNIKLYVHTKDRYERLVATVITQNGLDFSKEMLRKGAAWHYKSYDKRQELARLEEDARNRQIGLWAYSRPQEPWKYRAKKRQQQQQN